jgi:hypothetical protein
MGVWQGVAMVSLKFHPGPPCSAFPRPTGGPPLKRPYSCFRGGPLAGRAACGHLLPLWTPHAVRLCLHSVACGVCSPASTSRVRRSKHDVTGPLPMTSSQHTDAGPWPHHWSDSRRPDPRLDNRIRVTNRLVWHGVSKGVVRRTRVINPAGGHPRNGPKAVSGETAHRAQSGQAWWALATL